VVEKPALSDLVGHMTSYIGQFTNSGWSDFHVIVRLFCDWDGCTVLQSDFYITDH